MFYKLMAKLLAYPDAELLAALPQLRDALEKGLEAAEYLVLERFLRHLEGQSLTESQADYVQTFDLTPEHALHLTHHLLGDDKNRGPALIDLSEYYKQYGLEIAMNNGGFSELPDYLPLILEFSSQLAADEARMFLSKWGKVLNQLASNLEEVASPYAPLVRLLEQRSRLGQPQAVALA